MNKNTNRQLDDYENAPIGNNPMDDTNPGLFMTGVAVLCFIAGFVWGEAEDLWRKTKAWLRR